MRLSYADMRLRVARYLGYGESSVAWSDEQRNQIESVVIAGVRQFLTPTTVLINGREVQHEWSFTRLVTGTVTTVAGTATYDLSETGTFELVGPLTFAADEGYPALVRINEGDMRNMRAAADAEGVPRYYAVRVDNFGGAISGPKQEIDLYPTPDAAYVLTYQAQQQWTEPFEGDVITFPGASVFYDEAVLASCLAVAERELDDGGTGQHQQEYLRKLTDAVRRDIAVNAPDTYGSMNRPYDTHGPGHRFPGVQHGLSQSTYEPW